ncbi:hypothetical protein AWU68_1158 [Corynebacterium simulans]|uniref:Uncharacterized protein n=1 Tax=Corynebacterium simulans TaxID=146827 RepID=A0ABR5VB29_9CORY|nr:hypothetical protein AWU68_1158 [Corynebacterium simulans]KXU18776.1 hypothetical protein WM41_0305 [Corynebacterium simulans]
MVTSLLAQDAQNTALRPIAQMKMRERTMKISPLKFSPKSIATVFSC